MVQEWWGLNPQIKAWPTGSPAKGFVALAPDLYHGELAEHDEMDKASAPDEDAADRIAPRATWAAPSTTCWRATR